METEKIENPANNDDEISLIDLFAVLLKHKKLIILTTVGFAVFSVVFSIISLVLPPKNSPLPNKYTSTAYMLIKDSSSSSAASSMLSKLSSSGLGSLVGGLGSSSNSNSSLALYLATSNPFLDSIVEKYDLVNKWKIKKSPKAESRKALKKVLVADFDEDSSVFSISFTDIDPEFAQLVTNSAVSYLEESFKDLGLDSNQLQKENLEANLDACYNEIFRLEKEVKKLESSVNNVYSAKNTPTIMTDVSMIKLELSAQQEVYKNLKSQYELLKIDMASETPAFQVLERGEIPDQKSKPSRGKLCIILTFAGFFISVFAAFLMNAIENIKKDDVAMQKLSINKKNKSEN